MIRLVNLLYHISQLPAFRSTVLNRTPSEVRFDPGHDAVMMGYDFHLDAAENPQLIEVNTNAGGGLLALLAQHRSADSLAEKLRRKFLQPFAEEMQRFTGGRVEKPRTLVILDETPEKQFLFGEMQAYAALFREWGVKTWIVDPAELTAGEAGVSMGGEKVDLIYNRHCDFYLQTPALAAIRAAYLARTVCLTPNPFAYALLADKERLALWSNAEFLATLPLAPEEVGLLMAAVPMSRVLRDWDREVLWRQRENWVFKPVDRFASRGVFLGRKISRIRFDELPAATTLVQREIPPSETVSASGTPMKTDFRLYAYRDRIIGVAARLYRGQVTNMRTPGGGFAPVRVVN
jgi:hypothetical protein